MRVLFRSSNIIAIVGRGALYFALAAMVHRFQYLKYALAAVLVVIGAKIFVSDFVMDRGKFPPALSLGVTFALIAAGIGYSLWKTRGESEPDWPAAPARPDSGREGREGFFGGGRGSATARFEALTPRAALMFTTRTCLNVEI